MVVLELVILAFAVYGTSVLLVEYDGIGNIFAKMRSMYDSSALNCIVCTSCWVVLPLSAVFFCGWAIALVPIAIIGVIAAWENR